jgi:hypothetical protein
LTVHASRVTGTNGIAQIAVILSGGFVSKGARPVDLGVERQRLLGGGPERNSCDPRGGGGSDRGGGENG